MTSRRLMLFRVSAIVRPCPFQMTQTKVVVGNARPTVMTLIYAAV